MLNKLFKPDTVTGIGHSKLWMLPPTHPFYDAAINHDKQYELILKGESVYKDSKEIDKELLRWMLACAETRNSKKLKAEAYLFYAVVRVWEV